MTAMTDRIGAFANGLTELVQRFDGDEEALLERARPLLAKLVARDDWLDDAFAAPDDIYYRQYLLYLDPRARFSVVSFVWGPGQHTPVHDHTVWGMIGMLRGAEVSQNFEIDSNLLRPTTIERLESGDVSLVSPRLGDIHQVRNAYDDRVSISIHAYGGDIGKVERHIYRPDGSVQPFISRYSNAIPAGG